MSDSNDSNDYKDDNAAMRRAKPRYAAALKVELFTKGLNHHVVEKTANISPGGLFVCTEAVAETGEKMHLRIIFSDRDSYFDVKGEVAWVCDGTKGHPKGFGVQFIDLNRAQTEIINRFLVKYVNIRDR
ncbi:MAG: PilZ domain-containing protein [Bdellovibrionales bacterium]|nr:PilZ domain-containing protein [Bdellovibrionales bacterium]